MTAAAQTARGTREPAAARAAAGRPQPTLSVGRAGDSYELEADRVATVVVGAGPAPAVSSSGESLAAASPVAPSISRLISRAAATSVMRAEDEADEREEEPQPSVQRNAAEEPEEEPQAAVQRAEAEDEEEPQPALQRARQEDGEEEPQTFLQRAAEDEEEEPEEAAGEQTQEPAAEEEEPQAKEEPRTAARDRRGTPAPSLVSTNLRQAKRGGQPLDVDTRRAMEAGLGAAFGGVRVHTGADAVGMSRRLRAHAFTHGKDIFFNAGRYEPDSTHGRTLLAHELTHVVQQGAAKQEIRPVEAAKTPREPLRATPRDGPHEPLSAAPREGPREPPGRVETRPPAPPPELPRPTTAPPVPSPSVSSSGPRVPSPAAAAPRAPSRAATPPSAPSRAASALPEPPRAPSPAVSRPRSGTGAPVVAPLARVATPAAHAVAAATRKQPESTAPAAAIPVEAERRPPETSPVINAGSEAPAAAEPPALAEPARESILSADRARPEVSVSAAKVAAAEPVEEKAEEGTAAAGTVARRGRADEFLRRSTAATFEAKQAAITRRAGAEKRKQPAESKVEQAEQAVVPPSKEGEATARASQVSAVDRARAPQVDERDAKQRLTTTLQASVPTTLEEVDSFKEGGKGRAIGAAVKEVVTTDAKEVEGTYDDLEEPAQPETPASEPEELPDVEPPPAVAAVNPGDGVVGEVSPEHADMSEFDKQSDEAVKREGITDEQLDMVDEGDLAEANVERKKISNTVRDAPAAIKNTEAAEKRKVSQELATEEQDSHRQMREARRTQLAGTRNDQKRMKTAIERKREAVTLHMTSIYEQAKAGVKLKLEELAKKSLADFDAGQARTTRAFEDNVTRRMVAFKIRRYGQAGGGFLWAKDKLLGMDDLPEVKEIFATERTALVSAMDGLIARITAENKRVVAECRQIITDARQRIEKYVQGLGPGLRATGNEALKDIRGKLAAMDQEIDEKEKALQAKLAAKREAAITAIDQKVEKMKEDLSGGLAKLANFLLNAMLKFFEWALKKAGSSPDQLMTIVNKGQAVIKKIVSDPIGFLKNVIQAVRGGLDLFQTNIKKHLIAGLMGWLTGAMSDVPIQLPDTWDLKGILHLVLQILGLTWQTIRTKLVKRLGEKVVAIAEQSVDILKRLVTEGPIALWEMLKEKAGEIKEQVMEGIRNWAIVELVKQGLIKLVSFLNPVGAIVQAILAIYNTVMFFVENWQRIVQFVQTVFNSIGDIAMGRISAAAKLVENALAMTIPIILSFLARLLGLSGIGKAVSGIIRKIRKPIDRIVDKVVALVVKLAKKLVKKVKAGGKALKEKGLALVKWWKERRRFKTKTGESHTVLFKGKAANASLMVATTPVSIPTYLKRLQIPASDKDRIALRDEALELAEQLVKITRSPQAGKGVEPKQAKTITDAMTRLCTMLAKLTDGGLPTPPSREEPQFTPDPNKRMEIKNLSIGSIKRGTTPSGTVPEFSLLRARGVTTAGDKWVRMHLLSEALGGPGDPRNWVPAPNSVNTGPQVLKSYEDSLKRLVEPRKKSKDPRKFTVAWAVARVVDTYPRTNTATGGLEHFVKQITFKAGLQYPEAADRWPKEPQPRIIENVKVDPPPKGVTQSLNRRLSVTVLSTLDPIFTRATVLKMRDAQAKGSRFTRQNLLNKLQSVHTDNASWQEKTPDARDAILKQLDSGNVTL